MDYYPCLFIRMGSFVLLTVVVIDGFNEEDKPDFRLLKLLAIAGRLPKGSPVLFAIGEAFDFNAVETFGISHQQIDLAVAGGKLGRDASLEFGEKLVEPGIVTPQPVT